MANKENKARVTKAKPTEPYVARIRHKYNVFYAYKHAGHYYLTNVCVDAFNANHAVIVAQKAVKPRHEYAILFSTQPPCVENGVLLYRGEEYPRYDANTGRLR